VPRFLSPEWVEAFNEAVATAEPPPPTESAPLAARDGTYRVCQIVRGGPEGEVATTLEVTPDGVRLRRGADETATVTVVVGWEDAVALASGNLSVSEALTAGRIRVRGDLGVLAAGQATLAGLQTRLVALSAATTFD
jgi:hypothetical protein